MSVNFCVVEGERNSYDEFVELYNDWSIEFFLDGELLLDDVDEKNDDKSKFIKINGENKVFYSCSWIG